MKKRYILGVALLISGSLCFGTASGKCASVSLADAVNMALNNNPSVAITRYGEESAKGTLSQARGANSFSVTMTASASRDRSVNKYDVSTVQDKHDESQTSTSYTGKLNISLPIYSGGANQNNIKSGELGIDIAELTTQRKLETIKYDVTKAYYDVLEAQKNVAVYQDAVDKYQQHLTNVQQLYSAGAKARIDLIRSQVEFSNAKQDLIKKQAAYDTAVVTLRNLLFMDQKEPLKLTDDFKYESFSTDVNTCVDYAMQNRKDIIADAYTLEQKKLAVKTAKAAYGPTVNMNVSGSLSRQEFDGTTDTRGVDATVNATWTAFDSGVTKGKVLAAEAAAKIAELTLVQDKSNAELSLRKDYDNMREAEKRFESTGDAVKQAEEEYFIANEKYKAGEGIMLDVIDAQNSLNTARQNYISAQYDYARNKASLESDMGFDAIEEVTVAEKNSDTEKTVAAQDRAGK